MSGERLVHARTSEAVAFFFRKGWGAEESRGGATTNEPVTTCCSDALTRTTGMNAELRLQCLRNLTDLLSRTFKGLFVFPVLGHDDTVNFSQLAELWSTWLPQEALDTLKSGTYHLQSTLHPGNGFFFLSLSLSSSRDDVGRISIEHVPLTLSLASTRNDINILVVNLCCLWILYNDENGI